MVTGQKIDLQIALRVTLTTNSCQKHLSSLSKHAEGFCSCLVFSSKVSKISTITDVYVLSFDSRRTPLAQVSSAAEVHPPLTQIPLAGASKFVTCAVPSGSKLTGVEARGPGRMPRLCRLRKHQIFVCTGTSCDHATLATIQAPMWPSQNPGVLGKIIFYMN